MIAFSKFRLELLPLSRNNKPELIFMDQIEEVAADVPYKNESSIQIKLKDNIQRIILYNQVNSSLQLLFKSANVDKYSFNFQDQIAEKEWIQSIRSAHKTSQELLGSIINKKVGKIYGTEDKTVTISPPTGAIPAKNTNGSN